MASLTWRLVKARRVVKELAKNTSDPYRLTRAKVSGKLDLKHCVVKRPVEMNLCQFYGELDLRYCEFEQTVAFYGCTFRQKVNSGDELEAYTVYRKDFICSNRDDNEAQFLGVATFNGIYVEGSAIFEGAQFELPDQEESSELTSASQYNVDFTGAVVAGEVNCMDAVFEGPTSFSGLKCGTHGFFNRAQFRSQQGVVFAGATFDRHLVCDHALFKGPVSFNTITCGKTAFFDHARFTNYRTKIKFSLSSFGHNLRLPRTEFCGEVDFRGTKCRNLYCNDDMTYDAPAIFRKKVDFKLLSCENLGLFRGAKFGGEVDFRYARIGGELDFRDACIDRKLRLRETHIAQNFRCNKAEFKGEVDALGVKCNNLWASDLDNKRENHNEPSEGAIFRRRVDFRQLACNKLVFFRSATFDGEVDLRFARIGGDLDFRYAYFARRLRLGETHISQKLRYSGSRLRGEVELYGMEIQILELMEANPRANEAIRKRMWRNPNCRLATIARNQRELRTKADRDCKKLAEWVFPFKHSPGQTRRGDRGLDLTGTAFKRFHGGPDSRLEKELADKLLEAQVSGKFTRNSYQQLENHYQNVGDEQRARELHLKGHKHFRKSASSRYTWQHPWRKFWDWLYFHSVYYGHKPQRPLYLFLALLLLAVVLWASPGALCSQNPEQFAPQSSQSGGGPVAGLLDFKQCPKKDGISVNPSWNLWHGFIYSLTLMVPVIQFAFTWRWVPNPRYPALEMVATAQMLVGWVVVLLAIAAWTGLVKKE